jgi:hypothetical protein
MAKINNMSFDVLGWDGEWQDFLELARNGAMDQDGYDYDHAEITDEGDLIFYYDHSRSVEITVTYKDVENAVVDQAFRFIDEDMPEDIASFIRKCRLIMFGEANAKSLTADEAWSLAYSATADAERVGREAWLCID